MTLPTPICRWRGSNYDDILTQSELIVESKKENADDFSEKGQKSAKNVKKYIKRAKYLKILAKMYKI